MVQIRTLGELRQVNDDGASAIGGGRTLRRKPLALVCYLARHAPRAITRTELATLLWGERGEERARQSLRQALTEIKQALGNAVDVEVDMVRLSADAVQLDVTQFEREIAAGRVQEAVGRWRGDFLEGAEDIAGDGFRRWVENERLALHQQLGVAMAKLVSDAESRGDWTSAVAWAQRWATALPFEEPPHARLVETLRMSGRSADAMSVHGAFVTRLRTAFDAEPSPSFLQLRGALSDNAREELTRRGRGSAAIRMGTLAARGAFMDALMDAWGAAVDGSPVVVLAEGSAGMGLTRICDEITARVGNEATILRAHGTWGAPPLAVASELFDALKHIDGTAGAAPEALAELARLVPGLQTRFQHLGPATGDDGALVSALSQTLAAVSEEQPVLLVVDDFHAADDASRQLLASLAPRLTGQTMLLLASHEHERYPRPPFESLLGTRGLRLLRLDELAPSEVEAMLESMIVLEPSDRHELALRLHAECHGVPRDVRELITALVDDHLLTLDDDGTWHLSPALAAGRPISIPSSIRERARAQLERMSPHARALAHALAVVKTSVDPALARTTAGLTPDEAQSAIEELVGRRLVRESSSHAGQFELASPVVARAIASLLTPTQREALLAHASEGERLPVVAVHAALTQRHWHTSIRRVGGPALVVIAVGAFALWKSYASRAVESSRVVPVVALGRIADYREGATTSVSKPLTDMLATNLGRVQRLRVVSSARMYELASQGGKANDTSAAAILSAARRAGATELVDGALYGRADGGYRLDLRRVELSTGNIQRTHSVTGVTIFELADSGTARLASDFGEHTPEGSVADVTTRSLGAYHLYEEGLRLYYAGDLGGAEPLFLAALSEDSTFAMASFYAGMSLLENPHLKLERLTKAARLATRTTDRERLTILANLAFLSSSPTLRAISDTLIVRYPDEVEGYYFNGLATLQEGDFLRSLPLFNKVVAMDSLALSGARARCSACEALRQVISAYQLADSLPAAEREARRWTRLQPQSPFAWRTLADVFTQEGRPNETLRALDHEATLDSGRFEGMRLINLAQHRVQAGDFEQADRLLQSEIESGSSIRTFLGLWYRVISFRNQGRLEGALADARRYRAQGQKNYPRRIAVELRAAPQEAFAEAEVLYELGRYRESAALFDSISRWRVGDESASQIAHAKVWAMTHAAGSMIAEGDTTGLVARIDSMERLGPASGLSRDGLLHHYVRGLLLAARGEDEEAIAQIRRSIVSWNFGYTRANVALANILIRQGRPREAVAVLQPALRGAQEASNYYMSRTELHERLALAWAAAGGTMGRDSSRAHFAYVARAWSRSDPMFAARLKRAETGARP